MQIATFSAGCFWGVEYIFRQVPGVTDVTVGYTGGNSPNPTYNDVCRGDTGHAEAVEIKYAEDVVTYTDLVQIFFANHTPTTINRQGPDVGSQYRSAIFYHDSQQKDIAKKVKDELGESGKFAEKIVTEILPATIFYPAEEYHQQYFVKHNMQGCNLKR